MRRQGRSCMADKQSRQVMFSRKARDYLDGLPQGTRSAYVNGLVERDIARKERRKA